MSNQQYYGGGPPQGGGYYPQQPQQAYGGGPPMQQGYPPQGYPQQYPQQNMSGLQMKQQSAKGTVAADPVLPAVSALVPAAVSKTSCAPSAWTASSKLVVDGKVVHVALWGHMLEHSRNVFGGDGPSWGSSPAVFHPECPFFAAMAL